MATENKTKETNDSIPDFLKTIKDAGKAKECDAIIKLISKHTKLKPKMWGSAIIGFGSYHYKYESGREGDAPLVGLSPRSTSIVLYMSGAKDKPQLLKKLGKHKMGGGCVHVQKLEELDTPTLLKLVDNSITTLNKLYPKK